MAINLISIVLRLAFFFLIDLYAFQAFKTAFPDKPWIKAAYWIFHLVAYVGLGLSFYFMAQGQLKVKYTFWVVTAFIALYIPKLLVIFALFLEDITRLFRFIWQSVSPSEKVYDQSVTNTISREKFLSKAALMLGVIPFGSILYGVLRTKYDYKVSKIKVPIEGLPAEFEGFTITQISDLHTGSFDSKSAVERGIELVNAQNSDMIAFTGDLVNFNITEIEGFEDIYRRLKAKEGVFSILGNHDYYGGKAINAEKEINGEIVHYRRFPREDAHLQKVIAAHGDFGWKILLNENVILQRGESKMALIGVENSGKLPHFPDEGDLKKAVEGTEDAHFKVLLSHDPSHWDREVRKTFNDIALTLSGHTHGAQFGIEIPGIKWSPVKYMYKQWAGLYSENKQHLYVNRGFGFLAFSGRIGIRPEITVLELVKA
jgi:predicted MPP superfamily phosphohydrolase